MIDSFSRLIRHILKENVDVNQINDALTNHNEILINYDGDDETHTGKRLIQVYAYGLTKAGNPCIRAFEPFGDTKTRVPHWKLFRLDRISKWTKTDRVFVEPPKEQGYQAQDFNKEGDKTMSTVYQIASFNDNISDYEKMKIKTNNLKSNVKLDANMFRDKRGHFTKNYHEFRKNINNGGKETKGLDDELWKQHEEEEANANNNANNTSQGNETDSTIPSSGPINKDKNGNDINDINANNEDYDFYNDDYDMEESLKKWKTNSSLNELLIKMESKSF